MPPLTEPLTITRDTASDVSLDVALHGKSTFKVLADGTVTGPSGGAISGYARTASTNTFTKQQTFTPDSAVSALVVNVPDLVDVNHYGVNVIDTATDAGVLVHADKYGSGTALDIKNRPGSTGLGMAGHNYTNNSFLEFDNTGSGDLLSLSNTENVNNNPSGFGHGVYLTLKGYDGTTSYADGVVTNNNTVTSATAVFLANEVGKAITVGAVVTTIATYVSATQITTASGALVNGAAVTFSFARKANVGNLLQLKSDLSFSATGANVTTGPIFTTTTGAAVALGVVQISASTKAGFTVQNAGTGNGVSITQSGAQIGLNVTQAAGGTGFYVAQFGGYTHGPNVTTSQDGGTTLNLSKNGAGAGSAVVFNNAGTGLTLDVKQAGTTVLSISAGGNIASNTASGVKIGTGATEKLGFYGVTPVVQPGAYTQTYATAARTVPAATAVAVATTASGLASYGYTQAQADAIPVAINANQADILALKQVVNALIDDSQSLGFST